MRLVPAVKRLTIMLFFCSTAAKLEAQDSLPTFEVQERNGMVIIGWLNPYPELNQLVIQRSYDSSNGFKSIMSMPDPSSISNGYVDKALNATKQYYRIFYVQPAGRYVFTAAAKPKKEIIQLPTEKNQQLDAVDSTEYAYGNSSLNKKIGSINKILTKKDKLQGIQSPSTLDPILPENLFTPSTLIFSNKDGDLVISLPETPQKKYLLKVYKEDGTPVFSMKEIKNPQLLIDRSNFFHSGWFNYELFEGGILKEKNKFYIPAID